VDIITTTWLKSLGAIRPMAQASRTVYRLGEFVEIDNEFGTGVYPLFFERKEEKIRNDFPTDGLEFHKEKWIEMLVYGYGKFTNPTKSQVVNLILGLDIHWLCKCNYYNSGSICTKCGLAFRDRANQD
jgi:hypothetical protein